VWQAKDVFEEGVKAHPNSIRLLTALGSTLFAGALYDEAARRLCEASDLNPKDAEPYLFMGRIEIAAPNPLPCVPEKLARYMQLEPETPLANYFYAMAIWKQHAPLDSEMTRKVQGLLTNTVTLDPKCGDAYLQLGNLRSTQQDYHRAIDFYEKAIKVNPRLSEAHYRLGMAYDRVGDKVKARQEFQIHDEIEKKQAKQIDRQRREVKQFVVTTSEKPASSTVQ
jgi:tetratricopeptide (TPR) repeat protein